MLLVALWLCPQALASPRAARLDPSFGAAGRVILPSQSIGEEGAIPVLMRDDSLVFSNGQSLRRLAADGRVDQSFGQGGVLTPPAPADGKFEIDRLAVDSRGRLVVAGTAVLPEEDPPPPVQIGNGRGPQAARVVRYLQDGTLDPSFGNDGVVETDLNLPPPRDETGKRFLARSSVEVSAVAIDSKDRIILTGGGSAGLAFGCFHDWFFNTLTYAAFVARLTPAGALDPSFAGDGVFGGRSVAENPFHAEESIVRGIGTGDAPIYTSGEYHCLSRAGSFGLARLGSGGEPSLSFGAGGAARRRAGEATVGPDGAIVTYDYVTPWYSPQEPARVKITRLRPNGRLDRPFGRDGQITLLSPGGPTSRLGTAAIDARGRLLLGGTMMSVRTFRSPGRRVRRHRKSFVLVRLDAHGRLDRAFGPHSRIATRFGSLGVAESSLLLDSQGRAVMVGTYGDYQNRGLVAARYVIDR